MNDLYKYLQSYYSKYTPNLKIMVSEYHWCSKFLILIFNVFLYLKILRLDHLHDFKKALFLFWRKKGKYYL